MEVIFNPEQQFVAAWENVRLVLVAGGCGFDDAVDLTIYHVGLQKHMPLFREVKDRLFPRGPAPGPASALRNWHILGCWLRSGIRPLLDKLVSGCWVMERRRVCYRPRLCENTVSAG